MNVVLSTHMFLYFDLVKDGVLEAVKQAGFDGIELWAMKPHFPYENPTEVKNIRDEADRLGLKFRSAHLPLYTKVYRPGKPSGRFSPSSSDESNRRLWKSETVAAANACAELGIEVLVIHTDLEFPEPGEKMDFFLKSMCGFIEENLPEGMVMGLENTPEGSGQVEGLMKVLQNLDTDRAGITVDLGHALMGGDVMEALKAASGRLVSIHAHDNNGSDDDHLPPGNGSVPWPDVFETLEEQNFKGPFAWEVRDPTGGDDPGLRTLKQILKEIRQFEHSGT